MNILSIHTFQQYILFSILSLAGSFLCTFYGNAQSPFNDTWEIASQTLDQKWDLDSANRKGAFHVQSYKPIYITVGRWSSDPNTHPFSENSSYTALDTLNLNNFEAKFQISLKSKLWQGIFGDYGDLWGGFTQTAYWQIYNTHISRPIRELNYEPELMLVFPIRMKLLGFDLRMLGGGLNHMSNGRDQPLSRSWNRVMFNAAFERDNWQINIRPWIRIPDGEDENPEISNYIGRAEINVSYHYKNQTLYAFINQPFNRLDRGNIQLNYVFPVRGTLRFHLQFFTGYGETMVDYNHYQTTIGIGVSFFDWQ